MTPESYSGPGPPRGGACGAKRLQNHGLTLLNLDVEVRRSILVRPLDCQAACKSSSPCAGGTSEDATARQTGASKVTILKLLAEVGTAVPDYQRKTLVGLPCTRVQCDEICFHELR